jgi:glycosyltransferase involved in cell wall biosynthesis
MTDAVSEGAAPPRLRVAYLVQGFPDAERPANGLFIFRGAKAVEPLVDLRVFFIRAWKPGRRLTERYTTGGLSVLQLAAPQLPRFTRLNAALYQPLGWPLIRKHLADCDLLHSVDVSEAGIVASRWARWSGLPHVTETIGSDVNLFLPKIRNAPFIRGWEKHVHGVICDGKALERGFRALYPDVPNVHTLYRGIDLERYNSDGPTAGPLAEKPPVRFLYLGGFPAPANVDVKGAHTLLKSWSAGEKELSERGATLLLAGPNINAEAVQKWRATLQAPERVHIEGSIKPDLIPAYLRAADVLVVPSNFEGLPNVLFEASGCGRAILGSNVGGIPEVVADQETGLILPAGDVARWRDALVHYAANIGTIRAMGASARRRMETEFDPRTWGPKALQIYRDAIAEFHKRQGVTMNGSNGSERARQNR